MRILPALALAASTIICAVALASAPGWAQASGPGASGADSQNGALGTGGGGRRGGRGGQSDNKKPTTPRADDKAFRSAIDRLPDQKYDPWRGTR
jgi:hypothetical protein